MTKDITRFLQQPRKHYAAAYLEQGRPLLDSDFNESAELLAEDRRRAFVDVTGGMGSPDEGFSLGRPLDLGGSIQDGDMPLPLTFPVDLSPTTVELNGQQVSVLPVSVRPGTIFLGGMRFELESPEHIAFQRDFLQMRAEDVASGSFILYYLNAWEQSVTAVEDGELSEQALGGPDTSVRVRRMRRVEMLDLGFPAQSCDEAFAVKIAALESENGEFDWTSGELRSQGRLQLKFQGGNDGNPCTPDPPTQYLGSENQALCIMLTAPDRFVWAIDNGAPLYRVTVRGLDGSEQIRVTMDTLPRDQEHRPRPNQVVEFLPFAALISADAVGVRRGPHFNKLAAEVGVFTRVVGSFSEEDSGFDIDLELSISGTSALEQLKALVHVWSNEHPAADRLQNEDSIRHFYVRLWHDAPEASNVELFINRDVPGLPEAPTLERTGIQPIFHKPGRRGDYWTATLRVDARDRIVPFDLLTATEGVAPHGPRHFFMPLAVYRADLNAMSDCRPRLRKLRDMGCETRTVGDGLKSIGDFAKIQQAIDSLPPEGGRVVVRPGVYREELLLPSGVTLEGCGADTVIESPANASNSGLIRLWTKASEVKISSFRLHAVEQAALRVDRAVNVEFSSLDVFAFRPGATGQPPVAGSGASELPLLDLHELQDSVLRSVRVAPARRPALALVDGAKVRVEGLAASHDRTTTNAPAAPLVSFEGGSGLVLCEFGLESFGQIGLSIHNATNVVAQKLDIFVGAHTDSVTTRSAIDISSSTEVVLEACRLTQEASSTDHAALVLQAQQISVRQNLIRALPRCLDVTTPEDPEACVNTLAVAWGGIQVRGNSWDVDIVDNRIRGGLGHGITLGSVFWGTNAGATRREGAGRAQTTRTPASNPSAAFVDGNLARGFNDGGNLFPFDEGPLGDVLIAENRIEEMATNGISVLTVLGLSTSGATDLFQIERLRIERNVIVGNLRQLPQTTTVRSDATPLSTAGPAIPLALPVLPYAGVTLGTVTATTVANNQIVGNGSSETMPICGIFVLNGDGLVISKNRVLDNGGLAAGTLQSGLRAGIAVLLSGTDTAASTTAIDTLLSVLPDAGQEAASLNAGALAGDFALRVQDNVVRQPEGRALHAVSTGMIAIDGNFLCSRGYHGAPTPVDQTAIGDVVFVQGLGGPWETYNAGSFPANGQDFRDFSTPNRARAWFLNQISGSPRLYVGGGGGVLFHNNQVVYDWSVRILPANPDVPLSFFPVVILGQDHVGAIGNQFALRVQGATQAQVGSGVPSVIPEIFLAHALIGGLTTQVARNRFAEPIESARVSLITSGELLNITTLNHGTHPTLAYRWGHPVSHNAPGNQFSPPDVPQSFYFERNPALFLRAGVNFLTDVHNSGAFKSAIRAFFQLLNQRT